MYTCIKMLLTIHYKDVFFLNAYKNALSSLFCFRYSGTWSNEHFIHVKAMRKVSLPYVFGRLRVKVSQNSWEKRFRCVYWCDYGLVI